MPCSVFVPAGHGRRWLLSWRAVAAATLVAMLTACGGGGDSAGTFRTGKVDRGDIRVVIAATGNLHAVSTVDVGAQVSGQILSVSGDFNQRVSKGDVIAEIDPANFQARLEQARADLIAAEANLSAARSNGEEARVVLKNAQTAAERARSVRAKGLISQADLDAALLAQDQAGARVKSSTAAIAVAQASVQQRAAAVSNAELDLEHTRIRAPVDGVILSRTVQPGQTVAASFQTPVLFQIAEDLRAMELDLAIDEADVGQVRDGQPVSFTVDAYPNRRFVGAVKQVRMAATNTSNVISYPVIVSVDNSDQRLFPGMTANAEIEVGARQGALRLPNAALRFTPPGQQTAGGPGFGPGGGNRQPGAGAPGRGGAGMGAELAEKLQLTPEQRVVFDAAMADFRAQMQAQRAALQASGGAPDEGMRAQMQQRMAKIIDQLKPLLTPAQLAVLEAEQAARRERRRATVWQLQDGRPVALAVTVGLSDGDYTELIEGPVVEGAEVLTGVNRPAAGG